MSIHTFKHYVSHCINKSQYHPISGCDVRMYIMCMYHDKNSFLQFAKFLLKHGMTLSHDKGQDRVYTDIRGVIWDIV